MFQQAIKNNREAVYGILCHSTRRSERSAGTASGFMIAPGIIANVAHVLHRKKEEFNDLVEVIRAPDVGMNMESAVPVIVDTSRDLACCARADKRHSFVWNDLWFTWFPIIICYI